MLLIGGIYHNLEKGNADFLSYSKLFESGQ
jgi:hypothetical protein